MDICEHMEVVDANGQHVRIVEKVEGDRLKLIKSDALDPQHLFLDKSQVARVQVWVRLKASWWARSLVRCLMLSILRADRFDTGILQKSRGPQRLGETGRC
jgi:hypothetical protein